VLNPYGIALASDSAVTVAGAYVARSYNSADKIFPVVGVPVAVLHSGSASLFGVPWQVLIRQWAHSRGERQAPAVEDYAHEFTSWLSRQQTLVSPTAEADFFHWVVRDYLLALRRRIQSELEAKGLDATANRTPAREIATVVDEVMHQGVAQLERLDDFDGLSPQKAAQWCDAMRDRLSRDIEWVFDDVPFTDVGVELSHRAAGLLVHKTEAFETDAVLTFAGYGEDEFFPGLYKITLSGSVAGVVRGYDESRVAISSGNQVTITPLGITDAIHSFLRGSSPQYGVAAHESLEAFKEGVSAFVTDAEMLEKTANEAHEQLIRSLETVEWEEFVHPTLDVVETLPMAEMVRLADALVGLATLRQVVRGGSSVGGPVDLARVTRDSGFEWVRKKQELQVTPS
jgi:hypothetical protein